MYSVTATEAKSSLLRLMDETAMTHEPVVITGQQNSAVLLSCGDWAAIQETMYLLSVPGMRESIRAGLAVPVEECGKELGW